MPKIFPKLILKRYQKKGEDWEIVIVRSNKAAVALIERMHEILTKLKALASPIPITIGESGETELIPAKQLLSVGETKKAPSKFVDNFCYPIKIDIEDDTVYYPDYLKMANSNNKTLLYTSFENDNEFWSEISHILGGGNYAIIYERKCESK